jgi:hypothetical protein
VQRGNAAHRIQFVRVSPVDNRPPNPDFDPTIQDNRGSSVMIRALFVLASVVLISGCGDTNPFMDETTTLETDDPSTANSKFLFDLPAGLTMNDVEYDAVNDELVINNLPFDGPDGRYDRNRTQGGVGVYRSRTTATTGQIDHYAVFMNTASMQAAAAAGVNWIGFGYGGANVKRDTYSLPGGIGEYVYTGVYAAVRTRDDRSGLEVVTGNTRLLLDILDFDSDGTLEGAIAGNITSRTRTRSDGAARDGLPDVFLATVRFDPIKGEFVEGEASTATPDNKVRDTGTYGGIIGAPDGSEIGANVLLEGPAEIQEVFFEIIEWSASETVNVIDPLTGLLIGTRVVTTTGTTAGLNTDNREAITTRVDNGLPVGYLAADRSGLPAGATITSSTTDSTIITGEGSAREIGVLLTTQVP